MKKDDMPKETLAIIDVQTGKIEKIANFKSYKSPDKFLNVFAFERKFDRPTGFQVVPQHLSICDIVVLTI